MIRLIFFLAFFALFDSLNAQEKSIWEGRNQDYFGYFNAFSSSGMLQPVMEVLSNKEGTDWLFVFGDTIREYLLINKDSLKARVNRYNQLKAYVSSNKFRKIDSLEYNDGKCEDRLRDYDKHFFDVKEYPYKDSVVEFIINKKKLYEKPQRVKYGNYFDVQITSKLKGEEAIGCMPTTSSYKNKYYEHNIIFKTKKDNRVFLSKKLVTFHNSKEMNFSINENDILAYKSGDSIIGLVCIWNEERTIEWVDLFFLYN